MVAACSYVAGGDSWPCTMVAPQAAAPQAAAWCPQPATGLANLGNTCYLNSVLQCLAHTPPLAKLCLAESHSSSCSLPGRCTCCVLEAQVRQMLARPAGAAAMPLRPVALVGHLDVISRQLRVGTQEDAHEFLRCLVDALERDLLRAAGQWDPKRRVKYPTTLANQLFSGILRSQVRCSACGATSSTYDPFQDLSLELGPRTASVRDALLAFTAPEQLDGANKYRCDGCKQLVAATKQLAIYDEPNVLVIHLKRFNFMCLQKIDRHIQFSERLNLFPFLCPSDEQGAPTAAAAAGHSGDTQHNGHHHHQLLHRSSSSSSNHGQQHPGKPLQPGDPAAAAAGRARGGGAPPGAAPTPPHYTLHGVVVHSGRTLHSGHYYAFVRGGGGGGGGDPHRHASSNGSNGSGGGGCWHLANDSAVSRRCWEQVREESAYLLFYVRDSLKPLAPLPAAPPTAPQQPAPAAAAAAAAAAAPLLKRPRAAFIGPALPPGHPAAAAAAAAASWSEEEEEEQQQQQQQGDGAKRPKLQPGPVGAGASAATGAGAARPGAASRAGGSSTAAATGAATAAWGAQAGSAVAAAAAAAVAAAAGGGRGAGGTPSASAVPLLRQHLQQQQQQQQQQQHQGGDGQAGGVGLTKMPRAGQWSRPVAAPPAGAAGTASAAAGTARPAAGGGTGAAAPAASWPSGPQQAPAPPPSSPSSSSAAAAAAARPWDYPQPCRAPPLAPTRAAPPEQPPPAPAPQAGPCAPARAAPPAADAGGAPPSAADVAQHLTQHFAAWLGSPASSWRASVASRLRALKQEGWSLGRCLGDAQLRDAVRRGGLPQELLAYGYGRLQEALAARPG